jgi:hypothetical protein
MAGVALGQAVHRMGGKLDVYARMLRATLDDFSRLSRALQNPIGEVDLAANLRALHTIKGLAATLGLEALAHEAATAEKRLAAGPSEAEAVSTCAGLGGRLEAALPALSELADKLRGGQAQAAAPAVSGNFAAEPQDRGAWKRHLEHLATLLEQSDMKATEMIPGLRALAADQADPRLDELDDTVGSLQFEAAATLCRRLLGSLDS